RDVRADEGFSLCELRALGRGPRASGYARRSCAAPGRDRGRVAVRPRRTFPCARCGRAVRRVPGRHALEIGCPRCGYLIYDYPRPCAGMIVLKGGAVLTRRRAHPPKIGWLDLPGGFMEAGESLEGAARRELREETGLVLGRVRPLGFYWDRY